MAIIPKAPNNINDCAILKILKSKSNEHDGLSSKTQDFINHASPLLDLISTGPFRNYTLHNRDHSKKLLHILEYIVPIETLNSLSTLECSIIVYSSFLHDMGMSITQNEKNEILKSVEFNDYVKSWSNINDSINNVRNNIVSASDSEKSVYESILFQLYECAISSFIRPKHATVDRYKDLINRIKISSGNNELFSINGVSFEDILIDICASHNYDASYLTESKNIYNDRYPCDLAIAHQIVNSRFCAAVLRLTDILDFDRERTPNILYESLGIPNSDLPGAEVSICEWQKHMSIHTLDIRSDEVIVSAVCNHPVIERSIRDFCLIIEREIKDTIAVLNRSIVPKEKNYNINLPLSIRPYITSVGYVYHDVSLRLNQSAIINILMGEKLYSNSAIAIRELLQNSLDACAIRKIIENNDKYIPEIFVSLNVDINNRTWIEVSDNGIGMDDHVISEYLLKLGDSYYDSSEFKRHIRFRQESENPYKSISKFGIGILSVFMLADVLEVHTKSSFSPRHDFQPRMIRIERFGGLAFITTTNKAINGTKVKIRLRSDIDISKIVDEVVRYLKLVLIRPWYMIKISLKGDDSSFYLPLPTGVFYTLSKNIPEYINSNIKVYTIEMNRWSNSIHGYIYIIFGIDSNGMLNNKFNGKVIKIAGIKKEDGIDPSFIISNYKGNRVSVNGFRLGSFRTKNLITNKKVRLPIIVDIDVKYDDNIEYDVSRERLTKKGEQYLRDELAKSILSYLIQTNIVNNIEPELGINISSSAEKFELRHEIHERENSEGTDFQTIYNAVKLSIPKDKWPKKMHEIIANKLSINPKLVHKVIKQLVKYGDIIRPNVT